MEIILKHKTNNSDHGETLEVTVFEKSYDFDSETITTDKGVFTRSVEHSVSSPYGWTPVT